MPYHHYPSIQELNLQNTLRWYHWGICNLNNSWVEREWEYTISERIKAVMSLMQIIIKALNEPMSTRPTLVFKDSNVADLNDK